MVYSIPGCSKVDTKSYIFTAGEYRSQILVFSLRPLSNVLYNLAASQSISSSAEML